MNASTNVQDAEFSIVNASDEERVQTKHLPATLNDVKLFRHQKADPNPPYLQAVKDEMALDIELGLVNQFEIDQKKLLKKDIDELTKSNDYYQVSPKLLERLFNLGQLRGLCLFHNLKEAVIKSLLGIKRPLLAGFLLAGSIVLDIVLFQHATSFPVSAVICNGFGVASIVVGIGLFIWLIACFAEDDVGDINFYYEFMRINLEMENIKATTIPLPRMAKLKLKEAKDSGLFEDFEIAHPEFNIEKKTYRPNFKLDPVILGITKDSRMFMVAWWDIKKDIDKVKANIKMFKKFRVVA